MSIMASADFDDLGLTGTEGAFNATGFLGDSRDSDMEAVTLAAKIVPVFFFLVGVTGNVVTIVALYRSKVGKWHFKDYVNLYLAVVRHSFVGAN